MSGQEKIPTSHYENLGGMNEKTSKYVTGMMEFLQLINYDLNTPGAISKRPGSTQFLFAGTSGAITNMYEFQRLNGFSQVIASANTGIYAVTAGRTLSPLMTGFSNGSYCDMQTFTDWMWAANGQTFLKYNGSYIQPFGVPINGVFVGASGPGASSGYFLAPRYLLGYVNSRGFYSQVNRSVGMLLFDRIASGGASRITFDMTLTAAGISAGVSYFALYRNDDFSAQGAVSYFPGNIQYNRSGVFYLAALIPAAATLYTDTGGNSSLVNQTITADLEFYFPSYLDEAGATIPRVPTFMEIHQNSMFLAGISATPSTLWFSELANPEKIQPDYNFEVRTNDGDKIRALKSLGSQLVVFKENSFHKVVGDNPTNYELVEISTEYGALSDRAVATVDGTAYFIDPKGIVKYDGSSWKIISDRMEQTFRRMNLSSARNNCLAAHYSFRNQIWFMFPIDSATQNNVAVIYDYKADAWFKFEGFNASSLVQMEAGLGTKSLFYGGYSGMISHFSPSFLSDNGTAFSLIAQPRFDQPQGRNNTALFRRLWLDSDPVSGLTGTIDVTILKNMSNTGITTMSIYQSQFQSRLEFGVAAKAIGFIFSHRHASLPCTINGWVVGHNPKLLRTL